MRITYLKLQNLVNVYAGLKRKLVEIDFSKSQNKKILILGDNGSGKTVLLSCLQPYRETNDNREMQVLEDEKRATKEIHIQNGDNLYEIVHHYGRSSSQNKSFIKKNGEELNSTGNIRSFLTLLESELKITKDYFVLGRLGDNVDNFINLGMTERKKYLNKFIPSTDRFLEAYKRVSENLQGLDRQIKTISVSLEKYGDKEENEALRTKLQERKTKLEELKTTVSSKVAVATASLRTLQTQFQEFPTGLPTLIANLETTIESTKAQVEDLKNIIKTGEDIYSLEVLNKKIDKINDLLQNYQQEMSDLNLKQFTLEQEISSAQTTIKKNLGTIEQMGDLSEEALTTRLQELENLQSTLQADLEEFEGQTELMTFINQNQASRGFISSLDTLLTSIGSIISSAPASVSTYLLPDLKDETAVTTLQEDLGKQRQTLLDKEDQYKSLNEEYNKLNRKSGLLEILDHSEYSEHAKECPIVGMALGFKDQAMTITNLQSQLTTLSQEIEALGKEISSTETILGELERFKSSYQGVVTQAYQSHPEYSQLIPNEVFFNPSQLETALRDLIQKFKEVDSYMAKKTELSNVQEKISGVQQSMNNLEVLNKLYKENDELREKIKEVEPKLTEVQGQVSTLIKKEATTKLILGKLQAGRDHLVQLPNLERDLEAYHQQLAAYEDCQTKITQFNEELSQLNPQVVNVETELKQTISDLEDQDKKHFLITDSLERLDNIHKVRPTYKLVQDSLDPKKGIPLIFSKNYLVAISERANELLDVAYKGTYQLKFVLETRDFRIEILKGDGNNLTDITLASQGETSMTSISLSLAMLGQIMNDLHGYNILYLDEMDAELDSNNRKSFISVIDRQMELLGVDQTFIITHNNEFYSSDIDLILLNGYETKIDITDPDLMAGKTVIYKNY